MACGVQDVALDSGRLEVKGTFSVPDTNNLFTDVAWLREKIEESLNDPRPSIPAEVVFKRLRARHAREVKEALDRPVKPGDDVKKVKGRKR